MISCVILTGCEYSAALKTSAVCDECTISLLKRSSLVQQGTNSFVYSGVYVIKFRCSSTHCDCLAKHGPVIICDVPSTPLKRRLTIRLRLACSGTRVQAMDDQCFLQPSPDCSVLGKSKPSPAVLVNIDLITDHWFSKDAQRSHHRT